jgi:hypothetical protein
MPGLVPGIHVFEPSKEDVDGRDKPGHDVLKGLAESTFYCNCLLQLRDFKCAGVFATGDGLENKAKQTAEPAMTLHYPRSVARSMLA